LNATIIIYLKTSLIFVHLALMLTFYEDIYTPSYKFYTIFIINNYAYNMMLTFLSRHTTTNN